MAAPLPRSITLNELLALVKAMNAAQRRWFDSVQTDYDALEEAKRLERQLDRAIRAHEAAERAPATLFPMTEE